MPSKAVIGVGIVIFFVIFGVGIWYWMSQGSSPSPSPDAGSPSPGPAPAPTPASTPGPTGTSSGTVGMSPVTPPSSTPIAAPNVIGMAHQFGQVGDVSGHPQLWYSSYGSVNTTVRVRGTSLTMPVTSGGYTNGDVYAKFDAPFTGTIILENTDGTQLASKTLNNESSTVFGGAAHN